VIDRRAFIGALVLGTLTVPHAAPAQQAGKVPIIGYLDGASPSLTRHLREAFRQELQQHGWVEGWSVVIEYRSAEGRNERFPEMAAEMVRLNVSVIGNITGVSNLAIDLIGKWMELLKEAVPQLAKVAVLRNPTNPSHAAFWRAAQDAARALKVQAVEAQAKTVEEIEPAFVALAGERPNALIVIPDPLLNGQRIKVASLAERVRLPWITLFKESADAGALMSYGPSLQENYRRAAVYVDKILKGTKPGDIPVEQPTRFELVINLKAAKSLGLTIPQSLLARADQVIQ